MNKRKFNKLLYDHKKSNLEDVKAWEIYLKLLRLFKDGDKKTCDYLERIGNMNRNEKLLWRTKLAEKGLELTPDQLEDYIFVLSLAIYTVWGID